MTIPARSSDRRTSLPVGRFALQADNRRLVSCLDVVAGAEQLDTLQAESLAVGLRLGGRGNESVHACLRRAKVKCRGNAISLWISTRQVKSLYCQPLHSL